MEQKQITVFCGLVIHDKKVLMLQRFEEECKDAHLKWEFPGGKVDFGETPEEAIVREVFEEAGVKVEVQKMLPFTQTSYWDYDWGQQQTLCFVYLCKFISQQKVKKDHHVNDIQWIEMENVKNLDSLPGTNEVLSLVKKLNL